MLHSSGGGAPFRPGLLLAGEEQSEPTSGARQLLPQLALEQWREGLFQLCWRQHGGSGLNVSLSEALELSTRDRDWLLERIGQQRAREAREIEKASKGR